MTINRIPSDTMPSKSKVAFYHLPGGGGFMWAVATSRDKSGGVGEQAAGALAVLGEHLERAGLDRTRIVKAEVVVTDHDQKPDFDKAWAAWMPEGKGPVRSFVQSIMPDGDQVEIIATIALPADYPTA